MKKFFSVIGCLFILNCANAQELKDVGIAKYAVIEAKSDFAPLRFEANENAKRFTHLRQGIVFYADKQNENFFRVDLGDGKYYWVEKKFADVQGIIPQKHIQTVEKIIVEETKDKFEIFIPIDIQNSYSFKKVPDGLEFRLYDVNFDPKDAKIKNKFGGFSFKKEPNTLVLHYMTPALFGYEVKKHKKGLVVEINKLPQINRKKPLKGVKVAIDAGHGGLECGICAFDVKEKDVNLKISKRVKKALKKRGAKVFMTRKKDTYLDLYDRINLAQENNAQILISIHQNSLPNPKDIDKKHGVGVYYYNEQALHLANCVQKQLTKQTGFRDDGVNHASFALTRPTSPVSILVECGYLIKKDEMEKLINKKFQKELAKALTKGVEDYLKTLVSF